MGNQLVPPNSEEAKEKVDAIDMEHQLIEKKLRTHYRFPYKKFYFKNDPWEKFLIFDPKVRSAEYSELFNEFCDDLLKSSEISGIRLDLERSKLTLVDLENLHRLLKGSPSKIKVLNFNFENTFLSEESQRKISDILETIAEKYPNLVELKLAIGFNQISENIFADMMKSIIKLKSLNELYLSTLNSGLCLPTINDSVKQISSFENLYSLKIDMKDLINDRDIISVCSEAISTLPHLFILNIDAAGQSLQNEGLRCLCEPLRKCKVLTNISLTISNAGVTDLTPLIELVNDTFYLSFFGLDISVNPLSLSDLTLLERALMNKPFLVEVTATILRPVILKQKMDKKRLGIRGLMDLEQNMSKLFRKEIIYEIARKLYEAHVIS